MQRAEKKYCQIYPEIVVWVFMSVGMAIYQCPGLFYDSMIQLKYVG